MKVKGSSAAAFIIGGIVFFVLGLLSLLHEATWLSVLSQVFPDNQTIDLFGVIVQVVGQSFLVIGVVRATSGKFLESMRAERQQAIAGLNQNIQQVHAKIDAHKQAMLVSYNQTNAKLDALIANQKTAPARIQPTSCKFCGAKIEQGVFCPGCGRAN